MDAPKIRPININLKQIQTVDTSKQTSKAKSDSTKPNKASSELNKSTDSSKSSQSTQSSQSGKARTADPPSNQKKPTNPPGKPKSDDPVNDLKQSKSDKSSPKKSAGDQSQTNQTKKLKVPFAVKPANQTKPELKYSNENKNLRLLNQADETRKELLNTKIKKVSERSNDRPTDRSNLKSIDTSNKIAPLCNNQTLSSLKTTNGQPAKPAAGVTAIKPATNPIVLDKSKSLLPTPTAFGKPPESKGTNRLANFYLKSVPDKFNYLEDDSDDIIDINSFRNMTKARSQRKSPTRDGLNGTSTTSQPTNQFTSQFTEPTAGQPKDGEQFDSSNFSSQFLKIQKESLEISELINYRITNEEEKFRTRSVINHLMKVLIEYKRSTYQPKLVEELNASLQKFSSDA